MDSGSRCDSADALKTVWSRVRAAIDGRKTAQESIYWQYRQPVVRFIERRASHKIDAEALADDILLKMLDPAFLARADEQKGRFRNFLFTVSRHMLYNAIRHVNADKEGGHLHQVPLDDASPLPDPSADERQDFDRFYALEVLDQAMAHLRDEAKRRKSPEGEVLYMVYHMGRSQQEVAAQLGITVDAANNHAHRGRERFEQHLRDVLGAVASSDEEVDDEIRLIKGVLGERKRP